MKALTLCVLLLALPACKESKLSQAESSKKAYSSAEESKNIIDLDKGIVSLSTGVDRKTVLDLAGLNTENGAKQLNYFATP